MERDKIEYKQLGDGVQAELWINGQKVRSRSFTLHHDIDGCATATIEIVNPEVHVTAMCDTVIRNVTLKSMLHDWWKGFFK